MSGSGIHADQNRRRGGKCARGGRNGEHDEIQDQADQEIHDQWDLTWEPRIVNGRVHLWRQEGT